MGLFSKKKKDESQGESVKAPGREGHTKTPSPAKKTSSDTDRKVKKTATEKRVVAKNPEAAKPATRKETAAKKEPAKKETKTWHITKRADLNKWQVKATENEKATKMFNTKAEAEEYVKTLVGNNRGSKSVAHKKDGKFQKK